MEAMDMCNTRGKCRQRLVTASDTTSPLHINQINQINCNGPSCLRRAKNSAGIADERFATERARNVLRLAYTRILPRQNSRIRGLPDLFWPAHFIDGFARFRNKLREIDEFGLCRRCRLGK